MYEEMELRPFKWFVSDHTAHGSWVVEQGFEPTHLGQQSLEA